MKNDTASVSVNPGSNVFEFKPRGNNAAYRAIAAAGLSPGHTRCLQSLATNAGPARIQDKWRHARNGETVSFETAARAAERAGVTVHVMYRAIAAARRAGSLEVRQAGRGPRLYVWIEDAPHAESATQALDRRETYTTRRSDDPQRDDPPSEQCTVPKVAGRTVKHEDAQPTPRQLSTIDRMCGERGLAPCQPRTRGAASRWIEDIKRGGVEFVKKVSDKNKTAQPTEAQIAVLYAMGLPIPLTREEAAQMIEQGGEVQGGLER